MTNTQSEVFSAKDLIELARRQRHILLCLLVLCALFATSFIATLYIDESNVDKVLSLFSVLNFIFTFFFIYFVVKLAIAVRGNIALYVVMFLIFGLFCLMFLDNRAIKTLRANGVRVSLLGVNSREMQKLLDRASAEESGCEALETPA